ncbi:hypothetical protein NHX12_017864 [Muraenolepis orangiensis]|uniref:PLAC domain-containing protein n=1 Tax=Muraenolepis orangiensis TaxID=630683 RepID=A0A9Q0IXI9_9TELE|nr:hypothetical protein NHX12_017864 [Muraenolepis orangiensis]
MAGPWQRLSGVLGLLQLTLPIWLLYPPLSALPQLTDDTEPPLQGFEVVKDTFSHHFLSVGYHKLVEIPAGAQNISIQETTKSRNYLALKTQSGVSIINGNWGIDRPGVFIAAGTQLTYRRPNEIRSRVGESVTAPGPLTEDVHVYLIYQQPDPSVYYEYSVPLYNTHPSPEPQLLPDILSLVETVDPASPDKDQNIGDISSNEIPKDTPPTQPDPLPTYSWSQDGHTVCSATCGTGRHKALWSWDLGEWSECSRRCGPGSQNRQVICRQVTRAHADGTETVATVEAGLCDASDGPPEALENCDMGACARSWFTSPWGRRCSAECGEGSQTRTAVCLMDHVTNLPLDSCEGARPPEVTSCNLGPCEKRLDWYTGPWGQCSAECGNGTRTRGVACLLNSNGSMEVVDNLKCTHLPQPIRSQPCFLEPCGRQWYVTDWSACSVSCGGGYRVREARCLSDNVTPSDPASAPESREECNTQPCVTETDSSCRDQYHNCAVVVQARLCVYPYYRGACCTSCSRAPKPYSHGLLKNHIRR